MALLDDFGMNIRSLLVCGALVLFASVAYGAGSYQRTRDGQTLVWRDVPERGEEATWSGKRDKNGFATGSGVLTWYKNEPNILDTRRYVILINHYSGTMVRGKFKGAVTDVNAKGGRSQPTSVDRADRLSRRKKATRTRTARVRATETAEPTPTPSSEKIIVDTRELTSALATSTPTPDQSTSPIAEESQTAVAPETDTLAAKGIATAPEPAPEQSPSPSTEEAQTAVPEQTGTLIAKRMATPPSEEHVRQPGSRSTTVSKSTRPDDSLRSLSAPPVEIPKPPRTIDEQTVARLDAVYQSAVKANDVAIMDEILADDFVLVTDRGASLTKADLIKEAREKRTIYEHQEEEEGTQKVRVWRDTAVVTALLRIKGTRDQNPFDYKVWFSETYVRTPTGWRYVFGQSSISSPKPDAK
jgi:ketosteroid isomerase-like protein